MTFKYANIIFLASLSLVAMQDPYTVVLAEHRSALDTKAPRIHNLPVGTDDQSRQLLQMVAGRLALSELALVEHAAQLFQARQGHQTERRTVPTQTLSDLHLLAGQLDTPKKCVIVKIPTLTTAGRLRLAKRLVCYYSKEQVEAWQRLVALFIQNPHAVAKLRKTLSSIAQCERSLLSLWAHNDQAGDDEPLIAYVGGRLPKDPYTSNSGIFSIRWELFEVGLANAERALLDQESYSTQLYSWFIQLFTKGAYRNDAYILAARTLLDRKVSDILSFLTALGDMDCLGRIDYDLSEELFDVTMLVRTKELVGLQSDLREELQKRRGGVGSEIIELGALFKIYSHLHTIKNRLLTAYHFIGKVDALVSLAHLVIESPDRYSLPRFSRGSADFSLEGYWNMLLDENIVPNSITLAEGDPRIGMVIGSNNHGKTIAIKAIGLCALLSKLGVVPAQSCRLTFPSQIVTGIYITDTAGGKSLFEAHVGHLGDLIREAEQENGLTVMIVDEPAKGGNERNANFAVGRFLGNLINLERRGKKVLCFMTTHLSGPISMAEADTEKYKLLYGHRDHTVNDQKKGAFDDEGIFAMINAAMPGMGNNVRDMLTNGGSNIL